MSEHRPVSALLAPQSFFLLGPPDSDARATIAPPLVPEGTPFLRSPDLTVPVRYRPPDHFSPNDRRSGSTVLTDRKLIEALPQDIKQVLFAGGPDARVASPEDYTQILRIAQKLAALSPEARQDYLARINAATTSLDALERSVDAYIGSQQPREAEHLKANAMQALKK